jgi:hypothetical protein
MLSRRLYHGLFALVLLCAQAVAFAHTLSHLHAQDKGLPDKVCELCIAQAQLGGAAPAAELVLDTPSGTGIIPTHVARLRVDLQPLRACARAPPTLSNT